MMGIKKPKKLMIAGGGTGGHVWAGVAIIQAWQERFGAKTPVVYVGAKGRIEEKIIPKQEIPLKLISLGSLNQVSALQKLSTLVQLPFALLKSALLILKEKPQVVIGVGGYASGPVLLMASFLSKFLDIRTAILEQNSIPGMTNRLLAKHVEKVFSAFPNDNQLLPQTKVENTGNPIRLTMTPLPAASRDPFHIFIFGGSQGAIGLNSLVIDALDSLFKSNPNIKITHQTGVKDFDRVKKAYDDHGIDAEVHEFIFDMKAVYSKSSLLICRAGSSTLSEIAAINRASILIPLPTAADNHQYKNAEVFSKAGAALLVSQNETKPKELCDMILDLKNHPEKLTEMEKNTHQFYRPQAAHDIVKQFEF